MMLSLDTAYRSFGGEVEALSTPTIRRLPDSRRHQLSAIAPIRLSRIAAIVAPVGIRSIAMMRACLVSGPAADLDDAGADRLREAGLAVFRAVERVAAFGLVLGLVMGSSEVHAAPSAAPPQPRPGKSPGRAGP